MRKARIFLNETPCGILIENETGYTFQYDTEYIMDLNAEPVGIAFPLQEEPFKSTMLFPFFDGLIPEGWLLEIAEDTWKINPRDRFGLLLACCRSCIGAVSVREVENGK